MTTKDEARRWEITQCRDCGKVFARDVHYKRTCLPCYKESQGYKLLVGDLMVVALQDEIDRLQGELLAYRMEGMEKCTYKPVEIPHRDLLFLCHPDKHANSERAKEVTQWILSERAKK